MPCCAPVSIPPAALDHFGPGLHLVTGPNGSGKSSLARALCERTSGAALVSAESQQAFYERELRNDESDFRNGADAGTTVGALLGDRARAERWVAALGMDALWERGYRMLSTGESRKLLLLHAMLGGAMLREPSLLVLDDPFEGLDVAARAELAQAITVFAPALPVIVVGAFHADRAPFARELIASVSVVERGRVVFRGSANEWLERGEPVPRSHRPPPIELGTFYPPLDPAVPLVRLERGRVQYGDFVVFDGLELTVLPGQHTLIEGPNGSGKSTLLELITGDHPQAYSNALHLFGRRRGSGETVWDIKKNVGLVSARLHRDYRVGGSLEDVLISGLFDSIGVYEPRQPSHVARAHAWLEWLDLGVPPSASFRELSFGQQRLVLIARAAIKVPPLVVMDEPTSGLDPDNRARVLELVESLCTQHKSTVLLVTHRDDERAFWQARIGGARLQLGRARSSPDQ
jgi:molybdate transport system ATP-binding protein